MSAGTSLSSVPGSRPARFPQRTGRGRRKGLRPQLERCEPRILLDGDVTAAARQGLPLKIDGRLVATPSLPGIANTQTQRRVTSRAPAAFQVPGDPSTAVWLSFTLTQRQAWYRNEVGLFLVDDATGRIGRLRPGDRGYAASALKHRRVIFERGQDAGAVTSLELPASRYYGWYLIQDATARDFLARNPADRLGKLPLAFFSFAAANPDRFAHARQQAPGVLAWEDMTRGGDRDFNDADVQTSAADVRAPVVTIVTPPEGLLTRANPAVSGSVADDLSGVRSLQGHLDGGPRFDVPFDGAGHFQFDTSLPLDGSADGTHLVGLQAADNAGNASSAATVSFVLDTRPPTLTQARPGPLPGGVGMTSRNPTITGQIGDAISGVQQLQARVDNGPYTSIAIDAQGNYSFSPTLATDGSAEGTHSVFYRSADRLGNSFTDLAGPSFTLDSMPPVVAISQPTGSPLTNQNLAVTGTVSDSLSGVHTLEAQLDAGPFSAIPFDASGNFTDSTALLLDHSADGPHTLQLRATDKAGNVSGLTPVTFTLDTTPPLVTFDLDPSTNSAPVGDHQTIFSSVIVDGQTEPNLPVTLVETGATTTADGTGRFHFDGVPLAVLGVNSFHVQATDPAGNVGSAANTFTWVQTGGPFNDLTGWKVDQQGGSDSGQGTVGVEGDRVVLREGDSFRVSLERSFVIPVGASTLSFSYADLSFDTTSVGTIKDAFEASLLDASGRTLVHTIGAGRDAFFNISEGQSAALGSDATSGGQTVALDLSGVSAGTTATLILRLVNDDSDHGTSVTITSVDLPAGGMAQPPSTLAAAQPAPLARLAPVDLSHLSDVSASFKGGYARTSFSEERKVLYANLSVRNAGSYPADAPLVVGVRHISDPTVKAVGYAGVMPDGTPYYDFTSRMDGKTLAPGGTTEYQDLAFLDPNRAQFTYDLVFLGGLNRPPVFTTEPGTEAIVNKTYTYEAHATDPNGEPLSFSLPTAPAGMTVDAATGRLSWTPTAGDLGNRDVTLRVEDGRGGSAQQHYVLAVTEAPPNRPPVFTSTPVVDADVSTLYAYQVTARDADQDPLTFAIASGPATMAIDVSSGLVSWTPEVGDLGVQAVSLTVDDGRGGTATQSFNILVQQQPGNHDPVIISDPNTRYNLPGDSHPSTGAVDPTSIDLNLQPAHWGRFSL
jgi:hypothetical protein